MVAVTMTIVAALAGTGSAAADDAPHPAAIRTGACADAGEVVAALSDVSTGFPVDSVPTASDASAGIAPSAPLEGSETQVSLPLADILANGHSIGISGSASDPTLVACGDVGGRTVADGDLPVALRPVGASGHAGVAVLRDGADGTTTVTVLLAPDGATPLALGPSSDTVSFDTPLSFAGYEITVDQVTYDPAQGSLTVDALFRNTLPTERSTNDILSDGRTWISWDQQAVPLSFSGVTAPADSAVRQELTSYAMPEGFTLSDATLVFGRNGEHQAMQPLAEGAAATSTPPIELTAPKPVGLKGLAKFTITSAQIVPAACAGGTEAPGFYPEDADEASLVLRGTLSTLNGVGVGGMVIESFVTEPNGLSANQVLFQPVFGNRENYRDTFFCYPIGSPAQGRYTVTFSTNNSSAGLRDRKAKVAVNVP